MVAARGFQRAAACSGDPRSLCNSGQIQHADLRSEQARDWSEITLQDGHMQGRSW